MKPSLINIKKTNFKEIENFLYIGRANKGLNLPQSKWGNPFYMKNEGDRPRVIEEYEKHIRNSPELINSLVELKNQTLGCYCAPNKPCHGNVLIKLYEEFIGEE